MARIIGITGGSGAGKTTIVNSVAEVVHDFQFIPQDNYYKSAEHVSNQNITEFNFDHPSAFDNELLYAHLRALKEGHPIEMPTYDFVRHRRSEQTVHIDPAKLIIFEGIMIFFEKRVRELIDLKIYVDTPDDVRFIRRLQRDMNERGRTMDSVLTQYLEYVRPGYFEFTEPTKAFADLIVPEGGQNEKALEVLSSFMRSVMD